MSSQRYPPPRDRSPPRQFDRRSSNAYTNLAASSSYRPNNEASQTPIDRPPPRGPRADSFRGGAFSFTPTPRGRGSGFQSRGGDSWDRERDRDRERERDRDRDRDTRPAPAIFRRDDDRSEWPRRDRDGIIPERGPAFSRERTHVGRERSASPVRPRRDSKDNIGTAFNRSSESGSAYFTGALRGASARGRGRGDAWDRSRGRSSFIADRDIDLFPNRSRSREGWRERDREHDRSRNFPLEGNRNDRFDRREYDRPLDRDARGRDHDIWQRDQSPSRSSIGNRGNSPSALSSVSQDRSHKLEYDVVRKPLTSASTLPTRDARREADSDYFAPRNDTTRREPPFQQPPQNQTVLQSASLGLDYGPPPTTPAVPAPVASGLSVGEKPQPLKPSKPEATSSSTVFQPPSGPKAERVPSTFNSVPNQSVVAPQPETRTKSENVPQQQRPQLTESPVRASSDTQRSQNEPSIDSKQSAVIQQDRPLPPNIPSGPRITSGTSYKPRTSPVVPQTSLSPNLSHQLKPVGTDIRGIPNAPTGPRSASILPPSGPRASLPTGPLAAPSGPAPASWRRPQVEYRPTKPSIMNTMNRPHVADRTLLSPTQVAIKNVARPNVGLEHFPEKDSKPSKDYTVRDSLQQDELKKDRDKMLDVEMPAPASEDEVEDDEDDEETYEDDGLDEDYFANSEKIHLREMDLLRSRKPLPLLDDPAVIALLMKIQLLGIITEGLVPEGIHAMKEEAKDMEIEGSSIQAPPSPEHTPEHSTMGTLHHPQPRGRPLKQPPVNPIPTPPIDDLPFLQKSNVDELVVVFDEPTEDEIEDEAVTMLLRQQFEHAAWDERADLQDLFEFYRQKYPEWKHEIDRLERVRRETHEPTPDPGSPGAQSATSLPPSVERLTGRAARNATEFDMEKAILMSQQSAKEEEERREREAASNALPNYDVEAVVPNMLKPLDREPFWRYQDTNCFVPTELAVELMQYIPPEDDFTEEEQRLFINAFCQTPKKWGLIADQIPERSYQECIAHYYLTKNEARYKEIWRRSQPRKKRGRAATKPRSTALLSDMVLNEDLEAAPVAVTDSGRPRRAAAPTFGDVPDVEASITLPAAKRVALGPKEVSEGAAPKPSKGRKAGTATKTRKTKAQTMADNIAMQTSLEGSPVKSVNSRGRTLLRADNVPAKSHSLLSTGVLKLGEVEPNHMMNVPLQVGPSVLRARSPPTSAPVVTSYWSVPEQQKFRQLVAYYGRDYARIADFMKTKSQAMIKNHYTREISKGDPDLERFAQIAEDKLARGENLGRAPSPIVPPKRKYEAPVLPPQTRPLISTTEPANHDLDRPTISSKSALVDEFPPNALHRDSSGSIVAKASPRHDFLQKSPHHTPVQAKVEEVSRERPLLAQKGLPGPPRGPFQLSDDNGPSFQNSRQRQTQPHTNAEHILHHPHVVDLRGGDMQLGPLLANTREQLAQTRDSASHTQHVPSYQIVSQERPPISSSRPVHSRNGSLAAAGSSLSDHGATDLLALRNSETSRRMNYNIPTTQSPRSQPLQIGLPPRQDIFSSITTQQPPKPEPPKPAPAKRSNLHDMLNDDPPEPPVKRLSIDSHRTSIQTPPPQTTSVQASVPQPVHQSRLQDDVFRRQHQSSYGTTSQHVTSSDFRGMYSNSPVPTTTPAPGSSWLDRFDPRSSPSLYSLVPPSQLSSGGSQQNVSDGLRLLESGSSRRTHLGIGQVSPPPRQVSTPVSQFRSASAAPQHSRIPSLSYAQNSQSSLEQRSQQQHLVPPVSHPSSSTATPMSSLHHRTHSSLYEPKRLTIQEHKAQQNLGPHSTEQQEPADRQSRHRFHQDELLAPSQRDQPRHIAAPPPTVTMQQDLLRQATDHSELFRKDNINPNVPPPPSRTSQTSQLGHISSSYGVTPPRTYTPPLAPFGNETRGMSVMHNQHAHHHHHNISAQAQQQQQQQQQPSSSQNQSNGPPTSSSSYLHHQQQSQLAALPPQPPHSNLAAHAHQPHQQQNQPVSTHQQQQQQQHHHLANQHQHQHQHQPRFVQPSGLAPGTSYRFGQATDDRRG